MEREAYQRVRELFHELAGLDEPVQRSAIDSLDEQPEVLEELRALLGHRPELPAFEEDHLGLEGLRLVIDSNGGNGEDELLDAGGPLPERIGGYRVVERIGRGGMGVVYRCLQESPRREVAIKVLHSLAAHPDRLRRFHYEAEVLARLNHPYVTQVIQSGVDDALGRLPYLVMELVEGRDLVTHCESEGLGLEHRLRLFLCVCEGVEHAHRHGIVHRDLKPANILVGGDGRPRILDFGLARPSAAGEDGTPGETRTGSVLGSLAWMSPEQARGEVGEIDTRSDVYSLGVILYRLLAGRMPYEVEGLMPWEAARVVQEVEPKRLGRKRDGLPSDLGAVVGMALEKQVDRRYPSAGALARDLESFLAMRPVEARGNSAAYQLRKFARRHRGTVAAALLVLLALVAGVAVSTTGFVRARAELARSNEISLFLRELLSSVRPEIARSVDTELLRSILERAAARLDAGEVQDPRTEGELRQVIGGTFVQVGELEPARRHLERALALLRASGAAGEPSAVQALIGLARVRQREGRSSEAEALAREGLALPDLQTEARIQLETTLAVVCGQTERWDEALALARSALELASAALPELDEDVLAQRNVLAWTLLGAGRVRESEELARGVLAAADAAGVEPDAKVRLNALRSLLEAQDADGRWEEALATARQCIALERPVYGERGLWTRLTGATITDLLIRLGRQSEALEFTLEELATVRDDGRPLDLELVERVLALADGGPDARAALGQAIRDLESLLESSEGTPEERHRAELLLARAELLEGLRARALARLERIVPAGLERFGIEDPCALEALNSLGVELTAAGRVDEARALLEQGLDACARMETTLPVCPVVRHSHAEALLASGELEPAVEELERVLEDYRARGDGFVELAFVQLHDALSRLGRREEAADAFARWIEWSAGRADAPHAPAPALARQAEMLLDPPHPELRDPARALEYADRAIARAGAVDVQLELLRARCLEAAGEPDGAIESLEQALRELPEEAGRASFEALERAIDALAAGSAGPTPPGRR